MLKFYAAFLNAAERCRVGHVCRARETRPSDRPRKRSLGRRLRASFFGRSDIAWIAFPLDA